MVPLPVVHGTVNKISTIGKDLHDKVVERYKVQEDFQGFSCLSESCSEHH